MMIRLSLLLSIIALSLPVFADETLVTVTMTKNGAATYYIKGKLGGLDYADFMVDTGSGYLVINQQSLEELQKIGQAHYVKSIRGILATGTNFTVPVWRISSFTIDNQCVLHDVDAAVIPGKTRQILGLTALQKAGPFVFSFDPPQIAFSDCTEAS
jgi:predicted aspartyl protease